MAVGYVNAYLPYTSTVHWQPKFCAMQIGLYLSQSFASVDPPLASIKKESRGITVVHTPSL